MQYYVDGEERYQRFSNIEEAIDAAKFAPWANGNVFDATGTTGGYVAPEEVFELIYTVLREEM